MRDSVACLQEGGTEREKRMGTVGFWVIGGGREGKECRVSRFEVHCRMGCEGSLVSESTGMIVIATTSLHRELI